MSQQNKQKCVLCVESHVCFSVCFINRSRTISEIPWPNELFALILLTVSKLHVACHAAQCGSQLCVCVCVGSREVKAEVISLCETACG